MKQMVVPIALLLFAGEIFAQTPLTLEEALQLAGRNNLQIKKQEQKEKMAGATASMLQQRSAAIWRRVAVFAPPTGAGQYADTRRGLSDGRPIPWLFALPTQNYLFLI